MLPLSERQQKVLLCVIDHFNTTGEPVASAVVARSNELNVSSATIRNVMGELEELGLLAQPHTSAGRAPTAAGMRFYVNYLHEAGKLRRSHDRELERRFGSIADNDLDEQVRTAGALVSQLSRLTCLVSLPSLSQSLLREIRLSALADRRVLVILVTNDGRIFNRVVRVEEELDPATLERMQRYLNELALGMTLRDLRARVRAELSSIEASYRDHIRHALSIGVQALDQTPPSELYVEGTLNILEFAEITQDVDRLRDLLRALQEKERVVELLDRICDSRRPQALIGPELGWELGDDLSLIACSYYRAGQQVGVLGILGPMRMNYARIIPLVEYAARMLSSDLDELA